MDELVAGIRYESVSQWLKQAIPGLTLPLSFELIAGGHSNLTFRFNDANGSSFVLRRPPLGHVLQSAHDMAREYRIVSSLSNSGVPVAPALALCTDEGINDAPFYVMQFVPGAVLHNAQAAHVYPFSLRPQLGERVIEVLATLHQVDLDSVGLADLGRHEAYLSRQLSRWHRQWEQSQTHDVPEMQTCVRLLTENMPPQLGTGIVHGDYRLGNMIVGHENGIAQIKAVLDWELCTLGDPMADLGYLLNQWPQPGEPDAQVAPSGAGGFTDRRALCDHYEKLTGRNLDGINYYRAFSWWRLAAIGQGVYKRYLEGAMGSGRSVDLNSMKHAVAKRAQTALELLGKN